MAGKTLRKREDEVISRFFFIGVCMNITRIYCSYQGQSAKMAGQMHKFDTASGYSAT
ncbi:hypothetical protein [Photobacterium sp. R1]